MADFSFFNPASAPPPSGASEHFHEVAAVLHREYGSNYKASNFDRLRDLGIRFTSYSGVDIRASVYVSNRGPDGSIRSKLKDLATLQTISVSAFRDKRQVRSLGTVYDKGLTRGPRTIAGSMVFTIFEHSTLAELLETYRYENDRAAPSNGLNLAYVMLDQLPPFDVTINFVNEYGFGSRMTILGCELHSEGQVMSIEDMITEQTVQYTARNMIFMHSLEKDTLRVHDPNTLPPVRHDLTFDTILRHPNLPKSTVNALRKTRNPFI